MRATIPISRAVSLRGYRFPRVFTEDKTEAICVLGESIRRTAFRELGARVEENSRQPKPRRSSNPKPNAGLLGLPQGYTGILMATNHAC